MKTILGALCAIFILSAQSCEDTVEQIVPQSVDSAAHVEVDANCERLRVTFVGFPDGTKFDVGFGGQPPFSVVPDDGSTREFLAAKGSGGDQNWHVESGGITYASDVIVGCPLAGCST